MVYCYYEMEIMKPKQEEEIRSVHLWRITYTGMTSLSALYVSREFLKTFQNQHVNNTTHLNLLFQHSSLPTSPRPAPPTFPYKIIFVFSVQTLSLILITQPQGVWLFRNNHTPWRIRGIWLLPCLVTPQGHYLMIITSPGVALLLKCNTKF